VKRQAALRSMVLLAGLFAPQLLAQALIIPQIADGGGWQTTLVLTNTSTSAVSASLAFFRESGGGGTESWNPPILEVGSTESLSLPGSGTLFFHTAGTAPSTTVGWAELQANSAVVAYAIFTQRVPGRQDQDGTAPAAAGAARVLVPFDDASGFITTLGLANPNDSPESVSVGIQTTGGAVSHPLAINLASMGHMAFALPQELPTTNGQSGLIELYCPAGSISVLALRFNPTGAFTASPVYAEAGPPIIGGAPNPPASNPYASFLVDSATFQPVNFASGLVLLFPFTANADNLTYSVGLSGAGATLTNGIFTNNGQTFAANALQSNVTVPPYGVFIAPGGNQFLVSSASLGFSATPTSTFGNTVFGNIAGTLTVTGTPFPYGGASTTLQGAISGTYEAQLN
jgi:hypothetical protein